MNSRLRTQAIALIGVVAAALSGPTAAVVEDIRNATPNPITIGEETSFSVDVDAFLTALAWESTAIYVDAQFYICVNQPNPGYGPGSGPVTEAITVPVMAPLD
ncbi:hypothetical protein [Elongatibacter sediminis]|uniref:Uncharacterized protein n=1 Tax=Elongatibacter sediminis TaxID=3119006 RepID=A0AAW9RCC6_9GAMM